jgi:hypothetical protein
MNIVYVSIKITFRWIFKECYSFTYKTINNSYFCNDSCIEDEFHLILKCKKYDDIRKKYIKPYYWKKPSAFKLVQLLSVCNIKELNNIIKKIEIFEIEKCKGILENIKQGSKEKTTKYFY